jgi:hypothetical protein
MRVLTLAALAAMLFVPAAGFAQSERIDALGIRELRGERLPRPIGRALVAATEEGLVSLVFDDRLAAGGWDASAGSLELYPAGRCWIG